MARLKGKDEEIKGNLDQKYWVQKSDPLVLMRSVPFSLAVSGRRIAGMRCRHQ